MHELLALVVLQEGEDVREDADDGLAHLAVDEVLERDGRALLGLDLGRGRVQVRVRVGVGVRLGVRVGVRVGVGVRVRLG